MIAGGRTAGLAGCFVTAFAVACAGHAPPKATDPKAPAPDMTGVRVMVLPAQVRGKLPGLDTELAYWLEQRAPRTQWVFRPAMERVLKNNPEWSINLDALAVGQFAYMQVERIGEPLFTDLRRLSTLLDARYALVPVGAAWVPLPDTAAARGAGGRAGTRVAASDTAAAGPAGRGHVEMAAAIIDTFDGSVLWYGVVAGKGGDAPDRATIASAAQELARVLAP